MTDLDAIIPPLPRLLPRRPDSHKGDFGRALLIGGSQGMAGSIALAGLAALRSGVGLLKIATPEVIQATVASFDACAMTIGLPADAAGRIALSARQAIEAAADEATAVAIGPGLGRSSELNDLVAGLYSGLKKPLVIDADGLNALATRIATLPRPPAPRILTPHPGEFARLTGEPKIEVHQRESLAQSFAERTGTVVVLKGHRTVITDGFQVALNLTGNPGMATGGTGDVLTGIITALVCQGMPAYEAARLGVHVHGLAGDLAAAELGQIALIATDLIRYLPRAWKQVS